MKRQLLARNSNFDFRYINVLITFLAQYWYRWTAFEAGNMAQSLHDRFDQILI